MTKAFGLNGVRKHQKAEDPRFLYWADKMGLVVWGEMANAYAYSPEYVSRFTAEWEELVARDYNHPSIIDVGADQRELGRAADPHGPRAAGARQGHVPAGEVAGPDAARSSTTMAGSTPIRPT